MRQLIKKSLAVMAMAIGIQFAHSASAETITAQLTGVDPNQFPTMFLQGAGNLTGGAGAIEWTGVSTNAAPFIGPFETYCIDLIQDIGIGNSFSFTVSNNLASASNPGAYTNGSSITTPFSPGPMGSTKAGEIDELFGSHYNDTLLSGLTGADNRQAFQLAIWDIIYDNDTLVDNPDGTFYVVSGFDANTLSTADAWLSEAVNPANSSKEANNVVALFGLNGAQDQVTITGPPTLGSPPPAPLPSAALGGGVLFAGLVVYRIRRAVRNQA